jgi:hypothetical protein
MTDRLKNPMYPKAAQRKIAQERILRQQFVNTHLGCGSEMVRWFGAVQGQEYAQTKWGLGLRLSHLCDDDIEDELEKGIILRTHLLRPTWHFVHAEDILWMLQLSAPRVHRVNGTMYRQLELDVKLLNRCADIFVQAMADGVHRTRDELSDLLAVKGVKATGMRLAYVVMYAELEGILCSGKRRGNQFTYARLADRVKRFPKHTLDEALLELTMRYFQSRSPATIHDYSTWSGLTISECKRGIALAGKTIAQRKTKEQELYSLVSDLPEYEPGLYLLPEYDELLMGYKDRKAILQVNDPAARPFKFNCLVVYDGQVIGTYKRNIKGKAAYFELDFFNKPLNASRKKMLKEQLQRFEAFSGAKAIVIPTT